MEKPIIITIAISVLFFFAKLIEMKFIEKENKPMKFIIRDTLLVLFCAFVPIMIFFQASGPVAEMLGTSDFTASTPTQIFTDVPGF
jgi:RsiW-degrading membrane proteinase PrsW (M82 family)